MLLDQESGLNKSRLQTEQDIIDLIKSDLWMMNVLKAVRSLNLPDCWVCAGFVRSKVWDYLHGFEKRTFPRDVDVVYFAPANLDPEAEYKLEQALSDINPTIPWSVKNQARMHLKNGDSPYENRLNKKKWELQWERLEIIRSLEEA